MPVRRSDVWGIVAAGDVEGLAAAVDILPISPDADACRRLREWRGPHTRQKLANRMVDLLDNVVAGEDLAGEPR